MNTAPPLEYVTSFAEASQTMMQQLTTALLKSGESDADFPALVGLEPVAATPSG